MARLSFGKLQDQIRRLDEFIFNHKGKALPNYQGAKHMLSLSILSALLSASILFGTDKFSVQNFGVIFWLSNEIFHIDHVFILPGFFRKFFYPFFVAIITSVFLSIIAVMIYTVVLGVIFILGIIFIGIFMKVAIASNMHTPVSMPSIPTSSGSNNDKAATAVIDNSVTVTQTDKNLNVWEGSDGGYYERNFDGSFTKK